jgi:hypothetical protein
MPEAPEAGEDHRPIPIAVNSCPERIVSPWNIILTILAGAALNAHRLFGRTPGPSKPCTLGQRLAGAVCGRILCALILFLMVGLPWWWINHLVDRNSQPIPREPPPQGNSREQPAINAIWAAGGHVTLDNEDPNKPVAAVWFSTMSSRLPDADLDLLKQFSKLRGLFLDGSEITDDGLKDLEAFPHLHSLSLKSSKVTDAGLGRLGGLADLDYLDLSNTQVAGAGLERLQGLSQLRHLYLDNTRVTDAGLEGLQRFEALYYLSISGTQITDLSLERLKSLPNLQILDVKFTKVTREGLDRLHEARPKLALWNEQAPYSAEPRAEFNNPLEPLFP